LDHVVGFVRVRADLVLMPTTIEKDDEKDGHAMLMVGYSDSDQVFIVRNR
jgi:uncharacterized protein YkuJ